MSDRQPPASPKKVDTTTWVITGIILAILIVVMVWAVPAVLNGGSSAKTAQPAVTAGAPGDDSSGSASATPTPLPADAASIMPVAQAPVGTCFDRQPTVDSQGKFVDPIDCTQAHDSEVFYADNVTDTSYPDSAGWQQDVLNNCHPAFKTYTGITYGQNPWVIYYIVPSQQSWDNGSHLLFCYTTDPLGGRVSSVKTGS